MGLFSVVRIMHWLKVYIFYFPKAVIEILLDTAASVFLNDMGTFSDGLTAGNAVLAFCDLHRNAPFGFLLSCMKIYLFMRQMARFVSYISADDRQW